MNVVGLKLGVPVILRNDGIGSDFMALNAAVALVLYTARCNSVEEQRQIRVTLRNSTVTSG